MKELYVVAKVGESTYALLAKDVLLVDAFDGATPVPGVPAHVEGLVQVRGDVVPVIDLRIRFQLPPVAPGPDTRVLVVAVSGRRVALRVDHGREVVTLESSVWGEPPPLVAQQSQGFVKSVAQQDRRLLMLLDLERVVGTEKLDGKR